MWREELKEQLGEQLDGGLGSRRWRCSHKCGWGSRYRTAAGWSWGCCGGEEELVWELRRRRSYEVEQQSSCQQD